MGTDDEVFDIDHVHEFKKRLENGGVPCKTLVADGYGHAFDIWAPIYGEVHLQIVKPFVKLIAEGWGSQRFLVHKSKDFGKYPKEIRRSN